MKTLVRLMVPDFAVMLRELLEDCHVPQQTVLDRLNIIDLSGGLLRHYLRGGLPNYARGDAIVALWCDITGKDEGQMPLVHWSPAYRAEGAGFNGFVLTEKCHVCGQVIRGSRREVWEQMQLHHQQYGDQNVVPSWLSPRVAAAAGIKPVQKVVEGKRGGRRKKAETV